MKYLAVYIKLNFWNYLKYEWGNANKINLQLCFFKAHTFFNTGIAKIVGGEFTKHPPPEEMMMNRYKDSQLRYAQVLICET